MEIYLKQKKGRKERSKDKQEKLRDWNKCFGNVVYGRRELKKELNVDDKNFPDLCASTTLGNFHNFREEIGAMENLVLFCGHICLFSPKCHPEIAATGIEYDWGVSKKIFRKENKYVPKYCERDVRLSLDKIGINIAFNTSRRA